MVRGIGVDIIEIARIRESIDQHGNTFLDRIFTPREITYCTAKQNRYQHFAARFAAKEAVSKALSTGWTGEFTWRDVEVDNDDLGKPHIALHGKLREKLSGCAVHVSISHDQSHVVAMALIEELSV
ncbi:MAG: holo-ACP synthase [Bacteroidota bacterium]